MASVIGKKRGGAAGDDGQRATRAIGVRRRHVRSFSVSAERMRTGSRRRVRVMTSHAPSGGNLRGCGESNPDVLFGADQCAQGRQRLSDGREPVGQSLTALASATSSRTGGEVPCVTRTVGM